MGNVSFSDMNVFGTGFVSIGLSKSECPFVITVKGREVFRHVYVVEKGEEPSQFPCCLGTGNKFCLSGAESNEALTLGAPKDRGAIEKENVSTG